jgi:hypothetical protein
MKALFAIAALVVLGAGPVYADCSYPQPPEKIPDGNSATVQEMIAAQKAVKEFDHAINAYLDCIRFEHEAAIAKAGDKLSPEEKASMERVEIQKHNAAVDQVQGIADRFNEQVRAFKAKNDKKS